MTATFTPCDLADGSGSDSYSSGDNSDASGYGAMMYPR